MCVCVHLLVYIVCEVMQTLPLESKEQGDIIGDLSVCLDGMQVDLEAFASAEANNNGESPARCLTLFFSDTWIQVKCDIC